MSPCTIPRMMIVALVSLLLPVGLVPNAVGASDQVPVWPAAPRQGPGIINGRPAAKPTPTRAPTLVPLLPTATPTPETIIIVVTATPAPTPLG